MRYTDGSDGPRAPSGPGPESPPRVTTTGTTESLDFIRALITEDVKAGAHQGRVATRFPPEPNGYLHIGHAKSICLNFGVAVEFGGTCNLRFDDTNPAKEDVEYVEAIEADVRWLGFDWAGLHYASDYFERLYDCAETLIEAGRAYVDGLSADEIREYRGTLTEPGRNSPYRDRPVEREPGPLRADARRRVPGRRARAARQDRHGVAEHQHARPGAVSHPHAITITAPATPGASIRCTTTRTRSRMRSRASRTRSARWSSRITGRSTTG